MFRHFNFHQLTFLPSILWVQEPAQSVKYFQISRLFLCRPSLSLPASTILNIWNIWLQHCSNCSIHADIRLTLNITHWGTFVLIYRNGTVSQHRRTSIRMGARLTEVPHTEIILSVASASWMANKGVLINWTASKSSRAKKLSCGCNIFNPLTSIRTH